MGLERKFEIKLFRVGKVEVCHSHSQLVSFWMFPCLLWSSMCLSLDLRLDLSLSLGLSLCLGLSLPLDAFASHVSYRLC